MDFRLEWVKSKVTKYFGLKSDKYFHDMLSNSDDLEDQLYSFLDDDIVAQDESQKRFFYVYKDSFETLVEEEILVPEIGKKLIYSFQLEFFASFLTHDCKIYSITTHNKMNN